MDNGKISEEINIKSDELGNGLKIVFSATKSLGKSANKLDLKIYNLNEDKRTKLAKDPVQDSDKMINVILKVGYGSKLQQIYKGWVYECTNERATTDLITSITSNAGFNALNKNSQKVYQSKDIYIKDLAKESNLDVGKITTDLNVPVRPIVAVGNNYSLLKQLTRSNEVCYIDDNNLYFLKVNEYTKNYVPLVSPETGLLNTPQRKQQFLMFETMMNPDITLNNLVDVRSSVAKYVNGQFRVQEIVYAGDNYGQSWKQKVTCNMGLANA